MIYRQGKSKQKEVCGPHFVCDCDLTGSTAANQFKLEPSIDVSDTRTSPRLPIDIRVVPARRAHH